MIPACTGLPPGELMRRITPWVFLFLNAFCRASVTRSALASPLGSITPTTSTSAVCLPEVRPSCPRQSSTSSTSSVRYAKPSSLKKMLQRRARRCSLRAAVASVSITSRSQLLSDTRNTLHDYTTVPLFDGDRNESVPEAGAAKTSACIRSVGCTVRRAYQMQAPDIEKLSRFPVQLHRHVRAAVEISIDPALVAHGERRLRPSVHFELEAYPVARIGQIGARANYAF